MYLFFFFRNLLTETFLYDKDNNEFQVALICNFNFGIKIVVLKFKNEMDIFHLQIFCFFMKIDVHSEN